MNREAVLALSAVSAIYLACAISAFSDPAQENDLVTTRLAFAAAYSLGVSLVYFLGKLYCVFWLKLSGKSKILQLVETIIVPSVATAMVPGLGRALEGREWTKLSVFIFLFVVLMDITRAYRSAVADWFPEPKFGDRILFLQFPPKDRVDMLPMDIALAALIVYLFFRHFD